MARLSLLHVGAFAFPQPLGSQVYVGGLAGALARRGHRVVLACYGPGDGGPAGVEVARTRGVGADVARSGPYPARLPLDLLLARRVRRLLRRERFDVVHAHNVEPPLLAWAADPRGRRAVRVYGQHTAMAEELPAVLPRLGPLARWTGWGLDRAANALCDGSVALSEAGARHLRGPVAVVPPGIDLAALPAGDAARARQRWDLGDRAWVVYTGNLDGYQDLPVLLAAIARLPEAGLLVVTGADPATLERQADAARLAPRRRRFVRSRDLADVFDALAAAALAAVPRARCAGFPMKLLNSAAAGVPSVVARGSWRDLAGAIAVPGGDPVAMADAIGALLADPARRNGLSAAARADVAARWSWSARAIQLERFYLRLLRRG